MKTNFYTLALHKAIAIFLIILLTGIASCKKEDIESSEQKSGSNYSCSFAQSQYDLAKRQIASLEKTKASSTSSTIILMANNNIQKWKKTMADIATEAKKHGCNLKK